MSAHHNASPTEPVSHDGTGSRGDDTALMAQLIAWLPAQRWFPGQAQAAAGMTLFRREPVFETAELGVDLLLLHAESEPPDMMYQVLIGWRSDVPPHVQHAIIGTVGNEICYDALHDRDVTGLLLRALAEDTRAGAVTARHSPDAVIDVDLAGRVLTAEQSNTSVVYGDQIIMKFFRRVTEGTNPDAEVLAALSHCAYIPTLVGEIRFEMGTHASTLALATRYLPNSADGWAMATTSVRDLLAEGDLHADEVGGDFAGEANRLGRAVAQVHDDLAEAFGVRMGTADDRATLFGRLTARAERLGASVPALEPVMSRVRETYGRLEPAAAGEPLEIQRIHGDLHLGQVLRTVDGWVVLDFEGEPSRPLAERRQHHSRLRDVAGMMRSFHYAAFQMLAAGPLDSQRSYRAGEWVARNREAFLDGYAASSGHDPRDCPALSTAFELDKAVYEVAYEHRHRPGWEQIPLAAIRELTEPG